MSVSKNQSTAFKCEKMSFIKNQSTACECEKNQGTGWMDGWIDGWMDGWLDGWMAGWVDGKAGLRIAYSNQKLAFGSMNFCSICCCYFEHRAL